MYEYIFFSNMMIEIKIYRLDSRFLLYIMFSSKYANYIVYFDPFYKLIEREKNTCVSLDTILLYSDKTGIILGYSIHMMIKECFFFQN